MPQPCKHIDKHTGQLTYRERHQNTVVDIAGLLGTRPECIFSANAIFVESPTAWDLKDADKLWRKCWRVHQKFLALVRPKWIICLGNGEERSSFQLLKDSAKDPVLNVINPCDRNSKPNYRKGKQFEGSFDLCGAPPLNVKVLGVPHPSRFSIPDCLKKFIANNMA